LHPTFAYWKCDTLRAALSAAPKRYGFPMKELAGSVYAESIMFDEPGAFENINTLEDLQRAEARLGD
jgi:molybdopterin-guanine dinucleotide biosynthesis protein A